MLCKSTKSQRLKKIIGNLRKIFGKLVTHVLFLYHKFMKNNVTWKCKKNKGEEKLFIIFLPRVISARLKNAKR